MISSKLLLAIPVLAAVSLFTTESGTRVVRRLSVDCIQNVYTSVDNAVNIPTVPDSTTDSVPAYLALCQEWIRIDAYHPEGDYQSYKIVEDVDICLDWSAPHMALMEIYAALAISAHVPRIKYRHNCDRTKTYNEALHGFDYTTIQQVLNTPGLRSNDAVLAVDDMKQQCRRCLLSYDPQYEKARVRSKSYHHCFAWPEDPAHVRNLDPDNIPYVPYNYPGVAPFSTIIVAFRQRLYHSALEWRAVTDYPPAEAWTGVVYWLDPTTIGLAYADVLAEIPNIENVTSISILAGPLCATAFLPTGQVCHEYGEGLKDYLVSQLPGLAFTGYHAQHGVSFKIITSTAAANSRMVLAKLLICPPRSPSCLFPSAAKRVHYNTAIVLDDPGWMKSVDFMAVAGHHGTTTTKVLDASKIPQTYTLPPPDLERRNLLSAQHTHVNAVTDSEGYPEGFTRRAIPSDATINALTPQQILDDFAIAMDHMEENPNLFMDRLELIPTMDDIQRSIENKIPLTINQVLTWKYPRDGTGGDYMHGELATDADSGRYNPHPTVEYYNNADVRRHESMLRMQYEWSTAFYSHILDIQSRDDPSTIFEIKCPTGDQPDGSSVSYPGGAVVTSTADTVIIATGTGIEIKDAETGVVIATGVESLPPGTVYREQFGYKITDVNATTAPTDRRLVVQIDANEKGLAFKSEVQKVCHKYKGKLAKAVESQSEKPISSSS